MKMNNTISIKNLTKRFKMSNATVTALDVVSLELPKGKMIALCGPSGCGKSTLLNMLGSLDHPTSGSIELDGISITGLNGKQEVEYRRNKVGFIFQSYNLVPYLKAVENVALPMEFTQASLAEQKARAEKLLSSVGIDSDRQQHRPSKLSGGQQQRVAIARALANEPSLLLADEPTANLDETSGEQVLQLLVDLAKSGQTVIVATHNADVAALADVIVNMQNGKVVEVK